ncbi:MAG TPA: hypothetical protein VJ731_14055 [Terriglobales bacterium]|nr:hypothetical protein [Terriglobales bacterium]
MSAAWVSGGGGCRSESTLPGIDGEGRGKEIRVGVRAIKGVPWLGALVATNWLAPGTVFLQQSSALALGAHWPLRQHFIASVVRAVAKQSKGWVSNTIASTLIAI